MGGFSSDPRLLGVIWVWCSVLVLVLVLLRAGDCGLRATGGARTMLWPGLRGA